MSAPRSTSLSALGVLREPPAAGFPGSPRPARRALTGPTEQMRQVCAPQAPDPALNEGRNGADRETEAGHSQEWRVRLGVDMGPGGGLPGHHGWSRTGTGGWVLTPRRGSWH